MSRNRIVDVRNIGNGRVLVTFCNGSTTTCADDGSFYEWTGGMESDG